MIPLTRVSAPAGDAARFLQIAAKELREKKVPFIIRRYLPVRFPSPVVITRHGLPRETLAPAGCDDVTTRTWGEHNERSAFPQDGKYEDWKVSELIIEDPDKKRG